MNNDDIFYNFCFGEGCRFSDIVFSVCKQKLIYFVPGNRHFGDCFILYVLPLFIMILLFSNISKSW